MKPSAKQQPPSMPDQPLYQQALSNALRGQDKVLLAFSGGMDSTVLLHLLANWSQRDAIRLRAIHIHHGISPFADQWVNHCQQICSGWQIPLEIVRVQLQRQGLGPEAQARNARYAAFAQALRPGEALVCAQHQTDQAETVLLALKRGSGPAGLAAMPQRLPFAGTVLIRPLLSFSRQQLADYARYHQLHWIEDESNQDDRYDRNFLRLHVVPLLEQRWQYFSRSLSRSAQLCGEQEQLLDELLAEQLAQLLLPGGAIRIAPLIAVSDSRRAALLRRWFASVNAPPPSQAALNRLWQEVALSRQDASPRLQFADHEVRRYQQALWWLPCQPAIADKLILPWQPPFAPLVLPQGLGCLSVGQGQTVIRAPATQESVSVRFQAGGLWQFVGRSRRRTLKKLWQELQVPPWRRGNIPLLFYQEQLIAAPGFFITEQGQPLSTSAPQANWQLHWQY